ncbi:MAG TPA: HAMP domain-containing sensor histidine kinase [Acidimicrobiia bacterium]|nr:HAMP domain-containing sensor histidine kinase [Acidimicrobiia bacterium]
MSLRTRLALVVAAAVAVAVAVVSLAAYRSTRDETIAEIDRFLRTRSPLAGLIDGGGGQGPGGGGRGPGAQGVIGDDIVAQVLRANGTVILLGDADPLPVDELDLAIALGDAPDVIRTITVGDANFRVFTRHAGPAVAVQVGRDLTETESILGGLRNRLLLIGVAGALLAGVAGWWLAGRAVAPVRQLTGAAEHVAATGTLDAAIPVDRSDEIGRLAIAFNEMLGRLDAARRSQQRLVADASHELRTPLTSLRTNIELLAAGKVPESGRAELLADLTAEVTELGTLMGELVDLATVGRDKEEPVETDIAELVAEAVSRAGRRATVRFEVSTSSHVAAVRPAAVGRAISNLLDNAIKWSPPDGVVEVVLDGDGLTVSDRGPGIPPDDLPFVFQRFFRATTARSLPGSGLGLAIVAAVVEDHGWKAFAGNRPGGGAEVGWRFDA